jgi:hypothetical protein
MVRVVLCAEFNRRFLEIANSGGCIRTMMVTERGAGSFRGERDGEFRVKTRVGL